MARLTTKRSFGWARYSGEPGDVNSQPASGSILNLPQTSAARRDLGQLESNIASGRGVEGTPALAAKGAFLQGPPIGISSRAGIVKLPSACPRASGHYLAGMSHAPPIAATAS